MNQHALYKVESWIKSSLLFNATLIEMRKKITLYLFASRIKLNGGARGTASLSTHTVVLPVTHYFCAQPIDIFGKQEKTIVAQPIKGLFSLDVQSFSRRTYSGGSTKEFHTNM